MTSLLQCLIQEPDLAILDVTGVTVSGDRVGADVWWDDFDDDGAPENKRKKERRKPGENAKIIHYYWHYYIIQVVVFFYSVSFGSSIHFWASHEKKEEEEEENKKKKQFAGLFRYLNPSLGGVRVCALSRFYPAMFLFHFILREMMIKIRKNIIDTLNRFHRILNHLEF